MNDYDFDLKLKTRAKTEIDPVPAGFRDRLQAAVEELPEGQGGAKHTRLWVLRPALIAAALVVALLVPVFAVVWQGWLDPVVRYGDNGALIEEYTVAVNRTVEGTNCNVTLENLVTDGTAVYFLFGAQYDLGFDLDSALEWGALGLYPSGAGGMYCRIDDGSQQGTARFIGMVNSVNSGASGGSLLGQEIGVQVTFYDLIAQDTPDGGTRRYAQSSEAYYFDHITLNDSIDLREMEWEDGTRLAISPLSAVLKLNRLFGENDSRDDEVTRLNVTLEFADGTHLEFADPGITVKNQGANISLGWSLTISGEPGTKNTLVMSRQFLQLVVPETVTALIIDGVRYEVADAHAPAD